jgi:hypothetical protein
MVKISLFRLYIVNSIRLSKEESLVGYLSFQLEVKLMDLVVVVSNLLLEKISLIRLLEFLESMSFSKTFRSKGLVIRCSSTYLS